MTHEIGTPYWPARKTYEPTTHYSYHSHRHELCLVLPDMTSAIIESLCNCKAEVALYVEEDVIFFLYSFQGEISWSDTPFSYHLMPSAERPLPSDPGALLPVERDRFEIVLVNAKTNIVEGLRSAKFSHRFTVNLREAIISQANRNWPGQAMWDRQVRKIYARYTNSKAMLIDSEVRCVLQGLETRW